MKRRDTIIVAVLVNVTLLMILFATANKSSEKKKLVKNIATLGSSEVNNTRVFNVDPKIPLTHNNLLQQFAEKSPVVVETNHTTSLPKTEDSEIATSPSSHKPLTVPSDKEIAVENKKSEDIISIVVKKGDFLEKIARANNTSVTTLMKLNQLTTTQLKIGQILKVPVSHAVAESGNSFSDRDEFYTVKEGDSPWTIALRHKMKLEELLQLNDLDEYKARRLKPGDQLRIR